MVRPHCFLCDMWSVCDFRYDIDSKSPDLAKHVSKDLFCGSGAQLYILPVHLFDSIYMHVSNI